MAKISLGMKRKATESSNLERNSEAQSWIDRFAPQSKEKLAVHKKKIEEVESWFARNLISKKFEKGKAPILLLVGPTGSGKTTSLRVVAQDLDIHIKEWLHPITQESNTAQGSAWREGGQQDYPKESVVEHFMDFIFQGSRYNSLFDNDSQRIILLEEIPSIFLRKPEEFHEALRRYQAFGRCPLVIILCETSSSREFKLFPPEIKRELQIHTISFNPIANTLLHKAIRDIIIEASKVCGKNFTHPMDSVVESVVQSCQGDLRLAVNLLEMNCMGTAKKLANFEKKKPKATKKDSKAATTGIGAKDSSLYLFHSLGKILYSKREDKIIHELPQHLKLYERPPTKEVPEEVFERTCVSQDLFTRMLENNAVNFYGSVKSASNCAEFFSLGDHVNATWDPSGVLDSLAISVTMRGLMFHLEKAKGKTHFGTFKKPTYDRRKTDDLALQVRHEFLMHGTSTEMLVSDILPYTFIIRPPDLSQGQWDVLNQCVLVRKSQMNTRQIEISEKDVFDEDDEVRVGETDFEAGEKVLETVSGAAEEFEIEEIDFN
ncbi:cell cycle checkpoint protein RAD17 [Galendromus occidentalis]|uniref:Cell cycle checkpoint protein RAD17 n=1 Tax=Galendromus occidentalis TaxID=34638 RepID=A0AAJ7SF27_9ACAR|nr:cell cycle checkpoint protein RAD17 [Galendromus occidentalis]